MHLVSSVTTFLPSQRQLNQKAFCGIYAQCPFSKNTFNQTKMCGLATSTTAKQEQILTLQL